MHNPAALRAARQEGEAWSDSPIQVNIFVKGFKARMRGDERVSPYTHETSGPRWRSFAHAWLRGYDYAEGYVPHPRVIRKVHRPR